jgi:hypothetical protein
MSLVNELKERRTHVLEELNRVEDLRAELADFDRAIAALEPALTDEQPELFEDEQEAASEQLASDHALPPAADDVVAEEAPEPEFIELDEQTCEPVEEAPALNEAMQDEREQGYAPVTNPEADQVVSAMSWYSPKEIAERTKFDPFGLFKREKEDA